MLRVLIKRPVIYQVRNISFTTKIKSDNNSNSDPNDKELEDVWKENNERED